MPDRLVYSTDGGRVSTCPICGKPYTQCRCEERMSSQIPNKKTDGIVRVLRDRKHRGGKTVTVITGHILYPRHYAQTAAFTLRAA